MMIHLVRLASMYMSSAANELNLPCNTILDEIHQAFRHQWIFIKVNEMRRLESMKQSWETFAFFSSSLLTFFGEKIPTALPSFFEYTPSS